jgi:energy-coupling factor transporter ATP-binding protein EcfA2
MGFPPAAILSFITYAQTVSNLDAATLFTVITLFQLIRLPLMLFPMTLSAATDAMQAIGRLEKVFMAETRTDRIEIDLDLDVGIKVEHASWTWDSAPALEEDLAKKDAKAIMGKGGASKTAKLAKRSRPWRWIKNKRTGKIEVATEQHAEIAGGDSGLQEASDPSTTVQPGASVAEKENLVEQEIFQLHDIDLEIPRGALVAIVGAIGSGKSSLLSAMVNEMRRTAGKVTFGGTTSMVPQTPWIVAATLRENILFGLPFDEEKYWWAVREACLEPDLDMLEDGDATSIGEKGINLSVSNACVRMALLQVTDDRLSLIRVAKSNVSVWRVRSTIRPTSCCSTTLSALSILVSLRGSGSQSPVSRARPVSSSPMLFTFSHPPTLSSRCRMVASQSKVHTPSSRSKMERSLALSRSSPMRTPRRPRRKRRRRLWKTRSTIDQKPSNVPA